MSPAERVEAAMRLQSWSASRPPALQELFALLDQPLPAFNIVTP